MAGPKFPISLLQGATHLPVAPGGKIILRGSLHSRHDGSVLDAASTHWPDAAPGGASVDPGGIIDFAGGGFEVVAMDAQSHEVQAVATGQPAPACASWGVPAPCLVARSHELAHRRMLTVGEWRESLRGGLSLEVLAPLAPASAAATLPAPSPILVAGGTAGAVVLALLCTWLLYRRWARSARVRLARLLRQIARSAARLDPVLARVLQPALASTARAVRQRRLDPASVEGQRLERSLQQLQAELRQDAARKHREAQRQVAEELAEQVVVALEAAAEASPPA